MKRIFVHFICTLVDCKKLSINRTCNPISHIHFEAKQSFDLEIQLRTQVL